MLNAARVLAADDFSFADLRAREFFRLDQQQHVYLDYTGSALYADSQIRAHHDLMRHGLFGNPHSEHRPSRASANVIETARDTVLRFFDVDALTHDVVFTANTSAAIKLVAESYPFAPDTPCILSVDNHNSVNGIREYARRAGAPMRYLPLDEELRLRDAEAFLADAQASLTNDPTHARGLVAFPAQSNFSGVRHPLSLVTYAKSLGYDVLLDIAGFAPSHTFSLRHCPADFAALSFYKLFGYPTGLGALVARREALERLRRPWFAGGTVTYASVHADIHRLRRRHEGFEDGTQNFLGIAALAAGFALLEEVDMTRLSAHVARLASKFLAELTALRHTNGAPVARLYGPRDMRTRGGTIAFNVCDRDGNAIPYSDVEMKATRANIAVRGGCFCNPGCAEVALTLDPTRTAACLATLGADFTVERFADCLDSPVGAVRVSFGLANNDDDIRRAIELIATFRE
jgi:selenocysteine lyase/cysteine desulfurase